jgi:hypothetical protein
VFTLSFNATESSLCIAYYNLLEYKYILKKGIYSIYLYSNKLVNELANTISFGLIRLSLQRNVC